MNFRWIPKPFRQSICIFGYAFLLATFWVCTSAQTSYAQEDLLGFGEDPPAADADEGPALNDGFNDQFFGQQTPQLSPEEEQQQQQQLDQLNKTAREKAEQGDLEGALTAYDEAVQLQPNFESHFEKGKLLRAEGEAVEAIRALTQATGFAGTLEDNDQILETYTELGLAYLDTDDYETALQIFQGALTQPGQSRNAEMLFNLGYAQAEAAQNSQLASAQTTQEDLQKALASYDKAIKVKPDYAKALFERGNTHFLLGDLDKALDDLKQAAQLDPNDPEIAAQLGVAALRRGLTEGSTRNGQLAQINADLQLSVDELTRYLNLVPEEMAEEAEEETEIRRQDILLQRSAAYIGMGDETQGDSSFYYQNAIVDAEASLEIDPESPDAHYQKGLAHRMLGDFVAAKDAYSETIELSPASTEALLRRGILYFREADYESAQLDLSKAIRYSRGINPRASFWRGLTNSKLEQWQLAVTDYSAAIRYQPFYSLAYYNRGLAYMHMKRFERAKDDFNQVLSRERDNQQARSLRDQAAQLMR